MSTLSILVYGCDQRLLETRSWVLEGAGHRVVRAMDLPEAETLAKTEPLNVAVLCHSLTAEESRAALVVLRRLRPEVPRLVLTAGTISVEGSEHPAGFSAYEGPRKLLETIDRLTRGYVALQ